MMLGWILCWELLLLLKFLTQTNAATDVTNGIPPPSSVKMYSVNGNSFINWTYPGYNINIRVTFEVAAKDSWEDDWIKQCEQTERNSCDIVSPIFTLDQKCARHSGVYEGRVRACLPIQNGSIQCSKWVMKTLDIPLADQFSSPDFKIDGVYHGTQLRLSNRPFVVRHSNISLNCYYRNHLAYKILYWLGSNENNTIQEEHASFDMKIISLRLAFAPRQHTQICVQMAIINQITQIRHQWNVQCIQYTPRLDESSKYAAIGVGIAMTLLVIFFAVRLFKLLRSKFSGEKFILPSDLNELMNDVSVGPEDIERQNNSESAHMICLDLVDEKYDAAGESTPTQDSISMHPDSQKSLDCQTPFAFMVAQRINHAESIPYIADAEAAAFSPSHSGNGAGIITNNGLARSKIEDPGRYLTALCQQKRKSRNSSSMPLPDFPLTIEQLARARLFSSSMGDLASQHWDFTVEERRSRSTDNVLKSNLNEYCKTSEHSRECEQKPVIYTQQLKGKPLVSCRKTLSSDATELFSKDKLETVKAVCIENPTYSPNPGMFDYLDQTFYCVVNSPQKIDGPADAKTFVKRSNSAENCSSLHDRRVKSYGKRFHVHACGDNNFQSVKFFIPENDTFDDRLNHSQSNICLGHPSPNSPKRTRNASDADSGYHVENSSVSDASSMSPPLSPDEKLYPDVFPAGYSTHERHRCSKVSAHPLCSISHNAKLHHSANSLKDDGVSDDESPYVTEGSLNYLT